MQGERAHSLQGFAGYALILVVFVILLLIGLLLFLTLPHPHHDYYQAMLYTGIFALVLAVGTYLASALSQGEVLKLASTGSFWFGIAMLLGADLATPDSDFGGSPTTWTFGGWRIVFLVVILIFVAVGLAVQIWQTSSQQSEDRREEKREEWRRSTQVVAPPGQERR